MRAFLSLSHLILLFFTDCSYCKQNDYLFYSYVNNSNHNKIMVNSSNTMLNPADVPNWTSQAFYNASMNLTGWDILEVHSNPSMSDEVQAYHAGYIEGYITREQIWNFYWNILESKTSNKSDLTNIYGNKYFVINNKYIESKLKNSSNDPYWHQVNLVYKQLHGILDGYNNATTDQKLSEDKMLTFNNLLFVNFWADLSDITISYALQNTTKDNSTNIHKKTNITHRSIKGNIFDHCSALIKILPGNSDVYIGHDTWSTYSQMIRIIKRYKFAFKISNNSSELIPGLNTAFSSYPGVISSVDDFYVIGSGLVTMETTIDVYNNSLYSSVHPEKEVIEEVRAIVANRLAKDGSSWMKYFEIGNSGTYNNQWMIVNLNKFKPGFDPAEGFLTVMEQAPGIKFGEDQTNHILKHGYWASYNIPFYPKVYKITGNEEQARNNSWYSFSKCPRAKIFKREQSKVVDMNSMISLMRYNKYQTDPYSVCGKCKPKHNACNAIASRCDLNPINGTYSLYGLTPALFGAIDTKIVSYTLFSKGELLSISGPTTDGVPPFEWSSTKISTANVRHLGQPNLWNFDPIITDWVLPYSTSSDATTEPTTPKKKNGASPTAPLSLFAYLSVTTWLIIKSYV